MAEIHQFKLFDLFADPAGLYARLINRKGYVFKAPVVEFDAEFITTGWTSLGCAICCILIHQEKRAYVVMLDSVDLTAMRESLEQVQVALNQTELLNAARPPIPFSFGL